MDIPKWHPNERVDIEDVDFLSAGVVRESRRNTRNLISSTRMRVLDGFGFTVLGGDTTLRITRGSAIAASGVNGVVEFGQILSEGAAFQDVAFAAFGAATISVWIKFQYADGGNANRKFYDKATDKEKTLLTKTRQIAGWIAQAAPSSPGAEWVQLFSVAWDGAGFSTSVITDARYFLFEGKANAAPAFKSDWGGGLDRNADRATNGVKTLDRFAAAMIKKIEELQSTSARWWEATVEPLDQKVSRNGDLLLSGAYQIDGTLVVTSDITSQDIITALELAGVANVGTGNPDPDVSALLLLQTTNNANNAKAPAFWLHSAADGGRDGVVAYSQRIAEDDVDFFLATIVDSAFGAVKFTFDMDTGTLTTVGGVTIGTNAVVNGVLTVSGVSNLAAVNGTTITASGLAEASAFKSVDNGDTGPNIFGGGLLCKAWAIVDVDGGGTGAGHVTVLKSVNIGTCSVNAGGYLNVTLQNAMVDEQFAVMGGQWQVGASIPGPGAVTGNANSGASPNSNARIYAWDASGVGITLNNTPSKFFFSIWGKE